MSFRTSGRTFFELLGVPLLLFVAFLPTTSFAATGREDPSQIRLVVLFSTCTLNKHYLSSYDPSIGFTPGIDRIGREGTVFLRHRTEAGSSGIAFASIFSGLQASGHRVFSHPGVIPEDVELVTEALARYDYRPVFWQGHRMATSDLGYAQGVAAEDTIAGKLSGQNGKWLALLSALKKDPEAKLFVLTSFSDTHAPYFDGRSEFCARFPQECEGVRGLSEEWVEEYLELFRKHRRLFQADLAGAVEMLGLSPKEVQQLADVLDVLYRSSVEKLDQRVTGVIESIESHGLRDETLFVFTADHGELLHDPNEDFRWSHGATLQAEVLDVPLILWGPGFIPKLRFEPVTRSIDLVPTLLGLLNGESSTENSSGNFDFSLVLLGQQKDPDLMAFSHSGVVKAEHLERHAAELGKKLTYFSGSGIEETWVAVRRKDLVLKLQHFGGGTWEFSAFDLARDATEDQDIFDSQNPAHRSLAQSLLEYKRSLVQSFREQEETRGTPALTPEEELRRLQSLGYIQ